MDWRTFWNEDHSIYVSERHRVLHANLVAQGIIALLPAGEPNVLDWGCGEAEGAGLVAGHCRQLCLYDSAPRVRANLRGRYGNQSSILVLDEPDLTNLPAGALDVIAIVSVVQYVSRDTLDDILASLVPKLAPGGRLIIADVIPKGLSPIIDAKALLAFAWQGGFLGAALLGLAKTFFSNYRTLRNSLGLTQWTEGEMRVLLTHRGFAVERAAANIGHNRARMTFVATKG